MTKAHELRIFFDCARKTIVFVRLTTVRLSVCNSSSQLTYTRGYCIIHNTEGPQTELRSQTDLPTNQTHQIPELAESAKQSLTESTEKSREHPSSTSGETLHLWSRGFNPLKTKKTTVLFALTSKNFIAKTSWTEYPTLLQLTTSPTTKNHHSIV